MTVELERPFVWPEVPSKQELNEHFEKQKHDTIMNVRMKEAMEQDVGAKQAREELRLKAERLLQGRESWSSVDTSAISKTTGNASQLPLR
jgi:large subunit ribosomal protein L23